MKVLEKAGKTIEIAIDSALAELGVDRENTEIEIVEQPTKGIFGFGAKDALVRVTVKENPTATAIEFLNNIFEKFELTIDIKVKNGEEFTTLDLVGENLGILIGRRGETLDALQYLTNLTVSRKYQERHKFILDAENYRGKREETLERLAKKLADKVLDTGRSLSLEPMSPYERRIIHTVLQDYPGVRTFSEGEEPYRKVVITKKR
ncbi:MAG: RNA-binding cell elongation regulator Jag/EloR [Clostridiales bacterium]